MGLQQSEAATKSNGESQNVKVEEEKRRKAYLQKQDFEENRKKVLKLAENKRAQAERRARYEAQERMDEEKRRAEEITRALEIEEQKTRNAHSRQHSGPPAYHVRSSSQPDKPTPAPRVGRPSLPSAGQPGLIPNFINKRPSPHSSSHGSPAGSRGNTADRPPKVAQSPLIRSREITPTHSRQGSGPNPRSPPAQYNINPTRIQQYPESSSGSDDDLVNINSITPHPHHLIPQQPMFSPPPIDTDSCSDSENDYSVPNREPNFSSIIYDHDRSHLAHQVYILYLLFHQLTDQFCLASKVRPEFVFERLSSLHQLPRWPYRFIRETNIPLHL